MKKMMTLLILSLLLLPFSSGNATPILQFVDTTSGSTTLLTVTDNAGGDLNPTSGIVSSQFSNANWVVVAALDQTKPVLGSAAAPEMDMSFQITRLGTGPGSLIMYFSDNDFQPANPGVFTGMMDGNTTAGAVVNYKAYFDAPGNVTLKETTLIFSGVGLNSTASGAGSSQSPYSLTMEIDFSSIAQGGTTTGDYNLSSPVPEPASMLLLGSGLLSLVGLMRKFKK